MIAAIIRWAVEKRFLVLLASLVLAGAGIWAVRTTPVDALPDLSDVQVIIRTSWAGQAPQIVENQVTYPIATAMLAVPKATVVRGTSLFGDSYVYVLFAEGTDMYWARSRVLEQLSQIAGRLPAGVQPLLGPDATGVGWIFQYALVDRSGRLDAGQLRALQDWFLRFELRTVPGVAEVAALGGMVKQYQVIVDPQKLRLYNIPLDEVEQAIRRANGEAGGSVIEMAEAEYMVRAAGYLKGVADLRRVPVHLAEGGVPILLETIADIREGPEMRRGVGELDGQGEVAGGVVVLRQGGNALATLRALHQRLDELKSSLPEGVQIVTTYDRAPLIDRAIGTLREKLVEEFLVVAAVCLIFLWHLRSALVALIALPLGVLAAFLVMRLQGVNADIMSLSGIAIAIGAMVDAAIVMVEGMHRRLETHPHPSPEERWRLVIESAVETGPALFFSLLIITVSFLPVFALEAQEGRLFHPLAFTKTYAMAAAAGLSVTLVPVLMGYFVRGRIQAEHENPINRALMALYRPALMASLRRPRLTLALALALILSAAWPLAHLGSEFMPDLDEGDVLYMPTMLPGVSIAKATEVLQQTDRLIATLPEVMHVHGKVGSAETATDPAPMTMIETVIRLKPVDQWRPGMTMAKLRAELDALVRAPGVSNVWVMPIRNRLDMLATGVKTPVSIKVAGPDLARIGQVAQQIEHVLHGVAGTSSVYAERVSEGRFIDITPDRGQAARYGLNIEDLNEIVRTAIGGMNVTETIEGVRRFPVNLRYPSWYRDSPQALGDLPIVTREGAHLRLGEVAQIAITDGPAMIRSENGRLNGWIFVDIAGRDLGGYVADAKRAVAQNVKLPEGVSLSWSGQFQYLERAQARLTLIVPVTLGIIVLLLALALKRPIPVLIVIAGLPMALTGGVWFLYLLGYHLSVAVVVGFIALAGVSAETVIVMLLYLDIAMKRARAAMPKGELSSAQIESAVVEGALLRLRPKAMTVLTILAGLLPIMLGSGTGSEVMRRIAAPMVGGMVTAILLTLLAVPAAYLLEARRASKGA
ncbi:MAG: efflux RND transporter permease subunit [Alphaproteobacteria bacterium]|nr:MAG: efflux RND transporter permease subunit [Alphaproteobacteria bacterium]